MAALDQGQQVLLRSGEIADPLGQEGDPEATHRFGGRVTAGDGLLEGTRIAGFTRPVRTSIATASCGSPSRRRPASSVSLCHVGPIPTSSTRHAATAFSMTRGRRLRHRGADDRGRYRVTGRARHAGGAAGVSAGLLDDDERACLDAYVAGLRAEGCPVDAATVRRGQALQMRLFSGLPVPTEMLDAEPTPALVATSRERAAMVRFVLDRVAATASR